jgi:hypothetical protein
MFKLLAPIAAIAAFSLLPLDDAPPASMLHRTAVVDIPSVAKSLIAFPIRCGPSGEMFFRMYRPVDTLGGPYLEIERGAHSVTHTFEFQKIHDDSIPNPKTLKALDFQVTGSKIYILTEDADQNEFVLKFSVSDASYDGAVVLEKHFNGQKLAVFDSGGFITTGTITRTESAAQPPVTELATLQYGSDSRFRQYVHIIGDLKVSAIPSLAEMDVLSGTKMFASGQNLYILRPGNPPVVFVLSEGGGEPERHELWRPGDGWRPFSFQVSGDRALIGFIYDVKDSPQSTEIVQYSFTDFTPVAVNYVAEDSEGAFGCTDWRGNFYTIIVQDNHLGVVESRAQ